MADLTAADVTFAEDFSKRRTTGGPNPRIHGFGVLSFGDGVDTYPAGGIPIDHNALGMPAFVEEVRFPDATDDGSGILWQFDIVNLKIRGYSALNTEISGAVAATTINAIVIGF